MSKFRFTRTIAKAPCPKTSTIVRIPVNLRNTPPEIISSIVPTAIIRLRVILVMRARRLLKYHLFVVSFHEFFWKEMAGKWDMLQISNCLSVSLPYLRLFLFLFPSFFISITSLYFLSISISISLSDIHTSMAQVFDESPSQAQAPQASTSPAASPPSKAGTK